jgi:hypothetical protein
MGPPPELFIFPDPQIALFRRVLPGARSYQLVLSQFASSDTPALELRS